MTSLERSIVETVVYFDLFDYPLTPTELQRYLWQAPKASLGEVTQAAIALPQIEFSDGVFYLRGRNAITQTRAERYLESERKFLLRRRYIWLLSFLPGVRAIWIVNTLAYHNVRRSSDIDLLIVTAPGKIWSTRFFTTSLAKLLGLRPSEHHTQDTLCLSFYLTADQMDLSALTQHGQHERYEAYWLAETMPVYDPKHLLERCFAANPWLKRSLPNAAPMSLHYNRSVPQTWLQTTLHWCDTLVLWEPIWRWLQLRLLPEKLKNLSGPIDSAAVVLSPTLLKFHTRDPRPDIQKRWQDKIQQLTSAN